MLFNTYSFLFGFLPVTILGFIVFKFFDKPILGIWWLSLASIIFYGWTDIKLVPLILLSIIFNYFVSRAILLKCWRSRGLRQWFFAIGILGDLLLLTYYKYAAFILGQIAIVFGTHINTFQAASLPIGISFFTFTQIAYLADVYRNVSHEYR